MGVKTGHRELRHMCDTIHIQEQRFIPKTYFTGFFQYLNFHAPALDLSRKYAWHDVVWAIETRSHGHL